MKTTLMSSLVALSALTCVAGDGPFDTYKRYGRSEFYGFANYFGSGTEVRANNRVAATFGSGFGGGIGFGVSAGNYLRINTELGATGTDIKFLNGVSGKLTALNWNVGVDYNILTTRLTPLLTGKIGTTYLGGTLSKGRVSGGSGEFDLSYGVGGGVRWDITDHFSVKAVYLANWIDMKGSSEASLFHTFTVGVGYTF